MKGESKIKKTQLKKVRTKTKMLHVPFSTLSKRPLDKKMLENLKKKYRVKKPIIDILEGKQFDHPGEILKIREIYEVADPIDIYKLVVPPFYDQPDFSFITDKVSSQMIQIKGTNLLVQLWNLINGAYRVVISSIDTEIISVNLTSDYEIDPTTVKIGGYWFWEWAKLSKNFKQKVYDRVTNNFLINQLKVLSKIDVNSQPMINNHTIPIRKIAQMMLFFYSSTGALRDTSPGDTGLVTDTPYDPGEGMDIEDYPTSNYCTLSPDWPFQDCCVAHDYCYLEGEKARGCDECARFKCDLDFLECMLSVAGRNPLLIEMAFIYFLAVRAFGPIGFEYCDFPGVIGPAVGLAGGVASVGVISTGVILATLGYGDVGVAITLVGLAGIVGSLILAGKLHCGFCEMVENWVEKCEADRIIREEQCTRQRQNCRKKKKWWKKLRCKIKYFWRCTIVHNILKGMCWLVRQGHKIVC